MEVPLSPLLVPEHMDGRIWFDEPFRARRFVADAESVRTLTDFERLRKATSGYHQHPEIEINLFVKGEGVCVCGGSRVAVRAGVLLWIAPGTNHVLDELSVDLKVWVVAARPAVLKRTVSEDEVRRLLRAPFEVRKLPLPQAHQLAAVLDDVRAQRRRNRFVFNQGLAYAVARACTALWSAAEAPSEQIVHPAVLRAARILREDSETSSLDAVARRCGLSADHLARLFGAQMGLSFSEFRNRARVERFLQIYGTGRRYSLTEAALQSGFGSYSQFQRVFKQHCGRSPLEYARSLRG